MKRMNEYIKILVKASKTRRHELIEECLNYYGACGVRNLSVEQVEKFCRMKGLI